MDRRNTDPPADVGPIPDQTARVLGFRSGKRRCGPEPQPNRRRTRRHDGHLPRPAQPDQGRDQRGRHRRGRRAAHAAGRRRARRPRARRVRAGHDPRRGLHPPRPPREPGREQDPRPRRAGRRLLRRRHPLGVRGQDAAASSATPTSCRWPAASASGRTRAATGSTPAALTPEQRNRYQRHLLLPEVGEAGQQKLLDAKVLLLGAGGLGSPAALYLAAAGVGTIGIVDMDVVDASNLQRQILHNIDRIGDRKVDSAKKTLTAAQPRRRRRHLRRAPRRRQRARHHRRLRRHRRRHRQLPDPLPAQRRVA